LSDDGQHGLTIIGFIGSVFSPYYFKARQSGAADPENHCAINVALYGRHRRWAMTEHGSSNLLRSSTLLKIGPSQMEWRDGVLCISINEQCVPKKWNLRGEITLTPKTLHTETVLLNSKGQHHWQAIAPDARIRVEFEDPSLRWQGHAYYDMNWGEEPLEDGFHDWTWLRATTNTGTTVIYDATLHDMTRKTFALDFGETISPRAVPAQHRLRNSLWQMQRPIRSEQKPRLISSLEDTPFYTRNHVKMALDGSPCDAIHESLSLKRFIHPAMQWMLPYRMPRAG
jgi:carotenoid 1,2-hydratase